MAEPEIATKAPENDTMEEIPVTPEPDSEPQSEPATEKSIFPGDTPVDQGASLGEHCVTDRPSPTGVTPAGEITQLGGIDVYISKPPNYPQSPSKLLLFLTGATGLHSTNNQLQADAYASAGFLVVLPDMFENDPLPGSTTYSEDKDPSFLEQVKMRAAETAKSFLIDMWLARQTPEKVLPILHKVIDAAKDEFADAVANGGGIYSVGYCFGGRITLLLAGSHPSPFASAQDEEAGAAANGPYIKAGAIAHATLVGKDDFEGTKAPLAFVCVQDDQLFPETTKEFGERYLKENNVEHEFKTYEGVPHGFGVVGEYEALNIKQAQAQAYDQMLAWLKAH